MEKCNKKFFPTEEDNKHCLKWNLNRTAHHLGTCFPTSHIVVVRPAR